MNATVDRILAVLLLTRLYLPSRGPALSWPYLSVLTLNLETSEREESREQRRSMELVSSGAPIIKMHLRE